MPTGPSQDHGPCTALAVLSSQHDACHGSTTKRLDALHAKVAAMGERIQQVETKQQVQQVELDNKAKILMAIFGIMGPIAAIIVAHFLNAP